MVTLSVGSPDLNLQSGSGVNDLNLLVSNDSSHLVGRSGASLPNSLESQVVPPNLMHSDDRQVVSPMVSTPLELIIAESGNLRTSTGTPDIQPADPHSPLQSTRSVRRGTHEH